jgi:phage terminase large subunit-like protein
MAGSDRQWMGHAAGEKAVKFLGNLTLIGDYSGERWKLDPWQDEWIRELYGKRNPDGTRQTTKVSLWFPRGAGKTQQAAGIATYQLIAGPDGQEIYAAGPDRDKASRLFKSMAQMLRADKYLESLVDISDHYLRIKRRGNSSIFQALAADSDQGHSLAPSCLILDELHLWRSRNLYSALTSGFGKRKKGSRLEIQISTAGNRKDGLAWDLYSYAKNVRDGLVNDPETLVRIFEAPMEDDWTSPATWRKAMPFSFVDWDFIESECKKAQLIKWLEYQFRQLYLNQWIEHSAETWIDRDRWSECGEDFQVGDLAGEVCYAALDLSSVRDLTSLSLFFPESMRCLQFSWLPSEGLAEREEKDGVTYLAWSGQGVLNLCTGGRIVHGEVAAKVNEILQLFNVVKFVADPYSLHLIAPLLNQEPEVYSQNPGHMSPPAKWFETAVAEKRIKHNRDPLLAWCVGNAVVETDKYENISPCKGKSRKRIDPCVALVMAIGAWLGSQNEPPKPDVNAFFANPSNYLID